MRNEFDKLITDAAPEVPDCSIDRRVVRVLLHERMRQSERRSRWLRVPNAPVAASLVLLVLVGGVSTELGSDSFDLMTPGPVREAPGTEGARYRAMPIGIGSGPNFMPADASEEDAREMYMQRMLDQGEPIGISGIEIGGEIRWTVQIRRIINGEEHQIYREPDGYPEKVQPILGNFMRTQAGELIGRVRSDSPIATFVREFNDTWFEIGYWTYEYPELGPVTYYEGTPLE